MEYLIGIDAGATKSELVAYDLDFNPIYKSLGGYGNPSVNYEITIKNLTALIDKCQEELSPNKCIFIAAGIAGVDKGNTKELIGEYFYNRYAVKNVILNDVAMAAKAYFGEDDGILIIAGTGSSCFVQKDNLGQVVGGWGHLLGDEGSGYHTVIEGFKRITYQIDNDIPLDNLSRGLMDEIKKLGYPDIKSFIYGNEKKDIASLFPVITRLARSRDKEAIKLLEGAGKYLANLTITAYNRFNFDGTITIALKGGVFYNSEDVVSSYVRTVSKHIEDFKLLKKDISVTKAVCNIYNLRR